MGRIRTTERAHLRPGRRLLLLATTGFAVAFMAVGYTFGEDIALELQKTPTTTQGWLFLGWAVSGPPYLLALVWWHESRSTRRRRRSRPMILALAAWAGLSTFVLPAVLDGVEEHWGTGAIVGDPLTAGWAWGALATVIGLVFTGLVLVVLRTSVTGRPSARQRDLTYRFIERAWLVVLVASLAFTLYGDGSAPFNLGY